ncbi:MAG: hypothetical protein EOP83_21095 [Verrucomicrobiaceae bacterium]|nr:MAG: hypothetical protein EOP83_21095 [Verrucomicrobiaceae bacterium]
MELATIWTLVVMCLAIVGVYALHRWYVARLAEIAEHQRRCEVVQCMLLPHYTFSWAAALTHPWIRYDTKHGMFELHPEMRTWLVENCPKHRVMEDQDELFIAFHTEDDKFHFKMRWL